MRQLVASLLFVFWATPSFGQTQGSTATFQAQSNIVVIPTRVKSRGGKTVYGLTADQFVVEDNGVRRSIHLDDGVEAPSGLSLVVAVQCSRSASLEFDKLTGLGTMIDAITGDGPHEVAVISYGDGPTLLGDFSSSPETLKRNLSKLAVCHDNGAAVLDTVSFATRMLNNRHNHFRHAILLIGETRDHGSHAHFEETVSDLGTTNTVIYSVAFSPGRDEAIAQWRSSDDGGPEETAPDQDPQPSAQPGIDPTPGLPTAVIKDMQRSTVDLTPLLLLAVNALRKNAASELAALSGGDYINFTTRKGFDAGLQRIANGIRNYYLLSFQAPTEANPTLHKLHVSVPNLPDVVIQARTNYWSGRTSAAGQDGYPPATDGVTPN